MPPGLQQQIVRGGKVKTIEEDIKEQHQKGMEHIRKCHEEGQFSHFRDVAKVLRPAWWRERHALFLSCIPISILSTVISMVALVLRRWELVDERYLSAIEHPYAAQVFGIITGYLLIMRLQVSVQRWDHGMASAQKMETKWSDAFAQLAAFTACSRERHIAAGHPEKNLILDQAEKDLAHMFSLLHAVAVCSLCFGEGQAYGRQHDMGATAFEYFDYVDLAKGSMYDIATREHHRLEEKAEKMGDRMNKKFWPFGLEVLGHLQQRELDVLTGCNRQPHMVLTWLTRIISVLISDGLITIPPPIYSRVYQELSNGMLGYMQAYKVSVLPFPPPLTHISYALLVAIVVFIPVLIEKFTQAFVFTPVLTFTCTLGLCVMHVVTMQLEMPFGDDFIDLPLREMHQSFNSSILIQFQIHPDEHPINEYLESKRPAPVVPPAPTEVPAPVEIPGEISLVVPPESDPPDMASPAKRGAPER